MRLSKANVASKPRAELVGITNRGRCELVRCRTFLVDRFSSYNLQPSNAGEDGGGRFGCVASPITANFQIKLCVPDFSVSSNVWHARAEQQAPKFRPID